MSTSLDERTVLRAADGQCLDLDVGTWSAEAGPVELRQLVGLRGPVLDIGCGPGRLVVALAERGVPALGVDASGEAVHQALHKQACALRRSVFDPLPGAGRWASALLFDGNIGIGGDPAALLARAAELVALDGRVVVETGPHGSGTRRFAARVERGDEASAWFPWAQVGADAIADLGQQVGLRLTSLIADEGRWFAHLEPLDVA
jgi:SAM-dependent methyltransferase